MLISLSKAKEKGHSPKFPYFGNLGRPATWLMIELQGKHLKSTIFNIPAAPVVSKGISIIMLAKSTHTSK